MIKFRIFQIQLQTEPSLLKKFKILIQFFYKLLKHKLTIYLNKIFKISSNNLSINQ